MLGREVKKQNKDYYERIGIGFEFPTLYEKLTARQNLIFFGSLYKKSPRDLDALLESLELTHDADKKVADYSKGMKSRLGFPRALINDPDVLFLDGPTSGLDPANVRLTKNMILEEKAKGKAIILATHNMFEAQALCDRVAFIVSGRIAALDTPHALVMGRGVGALTYSFLENGVEKTGECLLSKTGEDKRLQALIQEGRLLTVNSAEPNMNASRTYKLLILTAVFVFFGLMSPLAAKYMPQMLQSFLPAGMQIGLTEPDAVDSWTQFFKNMSQIGLVVLLLTFSGMLPSEYAKGTLTNLLAKGLSRKTVVLSKFTAAAALWTACYPLAFLIALGYTIYFWGAEPNISGLLFAVFCLWLFGMMFLSIEIAGGALFNSLYGSLLFTGGVLLVLLLVGMIPAAQGYSPLKPATGNVLIAGGRTAISEYGIPVLLGILLSGGFLTLGIFVFKKKVV